MEDFEIILDIKYMRLANMLMINHAKKEDVLKTLKMVKNPLAWQPLYGIIETRYNDGSHYTKDEHGRFTGSTSSGGSSGGSLKLDDIQIGRSVGAKAKNYDVIDPQTGEYFHFVEGTRIQDAQAFAGKGCKKPLNYEVAHGLSEQIGGKPENWQHCKGFGIIDYYGEHREAEVHWFQEATVGKHKFKIKEWID